MCPTNERKGGGANPPAAVRRAEGTVSLGYTPIPILNDVGGVARSGGSLPGTQPRRASGVAESMPGAAGAGGQRGRCSGRHFRGEAGGSRQRGRRVALGGLESPCLEQRVWWRRSRWSQDPCLERRQMGTAAGWTAGRGGSENAEGRRVTVGGPPDRFAVCFHRDRYGVHILL